MAKKKDITRNPPSWIEKSLFIAVIAIIIGIAFPIFWNLNKTTRELYACADIQKELQQCIEDWRKENNITSKYDLIPVEELERRYGGPIPSCPYDSEQKLFKAGSNNVSCLHHKFDFAFDSDSKSKNE